MQQGEEEGKRKRQETFLLEERRRDAEAAKERVNKETREKRERLEKEKAKHDFLTLVGERVRDPYAHRDWERMRMKMEGDKRFIFAFFFYIYLFSLFFCFPFLSSHLYQKKKTLNS